MDLGMEDFVVVVGAKPIRLGGDYILRGGPVSLRKAQA